MCAANPESRQYPLPAMEIICAAPTRFILDKTDTHQDRRLIEEMFGSD
jgi:hypothetical protein